MLRSILGRAAALALILSTGAAAQRGGTACDITLSSWLVIAPFSTAAGPDQFDLGSPATVMPQAGNMVAGKTWQPATLNAQGRLDLNPIYGSTAALANMAIYAFTYLASPAARTVTLGVDGQGTITLWLNGVRVDADPAQAAGRGGGATAPTFTLALRPGVNRLLYKLANRGAAPGMGGGLLARSRDAYGDIVIADRPDVSVVQTPDVP